jgi:hypothetical protein
MERFSKAHVDLALDFSATADYMLWKNAGFMRGQKVGQIWPREMASACSCAEYPVVPTRRPKSLAWQAGLGGLCGVHLDQT